MAKIIDFFLIKLINFNIQKKIVYILSPIFYTNGAINYWTKNANLGKFTVFFYQIFIFSSKIIFVYVFLWTAIELGRKF